MADLIKYLPLLFFILVAVSIVRNVLRVLRKMGEAETKAPRQPDDYDSAMAERTRRIQDEIRRKIAERRGTLVAETQPVGPRKEPPLMSVDERAERESTASTNAAVLERQQQLANQMRALEQARATGVRRAAQISATQKTESESERGMLAGSRVDLLADLRDPSSLRRAFVLREVLGAPVGLR